MKLNRGRTLFAFLCVATGVAAIVTLRSLALMVGDELTTNLAQINRGDIRLYATRDVPELVTLTDQGIPVFKAAVVSAISSWAGERGIETTQARMSAFLPVRHFSADGESRAYTVIPLFVEPEIYPFYDVISMREPVGWTLRDVWASALGDTVSSSEIRPVVVSNQLFRKGVRVGDQLQVGASDLTFEVRGVASPAAETLLTHPSAAFLGDYIYLSLADLSLVGEPPLADQMFFRLASGMDAMEVEGDLIAFLEREVQAETDLAASLRRSTVDDLAERNREVAGVIDDLIVVIGLTALVIGGVGVANTMLVMVNWRIMEIATLKTLGLEAYKVTALFLIEALLLGAAGSAAGAVVGVGLSYAVQGVGEQAFALSLHWRIYPEAIGSGLWLGTLVSGLFGLLPTLLAGQVRPAVVLRPNGAHLPVAGLLQVMIVVVAMNLVFGVMVGSIAGDIIRTTPELMMGTIGGIAGAFGGVGVFRSWRTALWLEGHGRAGRGISMLAVLPLGMTVWGVCALALNVIRGDTVSGMMPWADGSNAEDWLQLLVGGLVTIGVVVFLQWIAPRESGMVGSAVWGGVLLAISLAGLGVVGRLILEGSAIWDAAEQISVGVLLVTGLMLLLGLIYLIFWGLVWGLGQTPPIILFLAVWLSVVMGGWLGLSHVNESVGQGTRWIAVAGMILAMGWILYRYVWNSRQDSHANMQLARYVPLLVGGVGGLAVVVATGFLASLVFCTLALGVWLARRQVFLAEIRIVLRAMTNRRGRVALTMLALSGGIGGLSLVSLMSTAASRTLEYQLGEAAEGNLLIVDPTSRHGDEIGQLLAEEDGVLSFSQVTTYRGVLMERNGKPVFLRDAGDETASARFQGDQRREQGWPLGIVQRTALADIPNYNMKAGRALQSGDEGTHRIMIRESLVTTRLGIQPDDRLLILFENGLGSADDVLMQFRVVGIVSRQSQQTGLEDMGNLSVLPPGVLPEAVKPEAIATIANVDESDPRQMDAVMGALATIPGVFSFELGALTQLAENVLQQLKAIPTLVAWLTLVAGAAIIANTVALATQERRREIGIMKAIGLSGRRALMLLLFENGLIGLFSGLIGVAIGAGVTLLVVRLGPTPEAQWEVLALGAMGWLVVLAVAVALVAAMLTAWGAAREKPMHVLRYE